MQTHDNNSPLKRDEVIPFKAEHIDLMQISDKNKTIFKIPHLLKIYEQLESSFTFMDEGEYLCAGGVIAFWEGVGEAWFILSDNMDLAKFTICTTVKKYLDILLDGPFVRIQATIKADDEKSIRFVEWLGFEREGLLRKYGIERADYYLYSRIE